MARKEGRWLTIGTAPTARAWMEAIAPFLRRDDCQVTAFSSSRLVAIRDAILSEYPLVEVGEFGTVTSRAFLRMGASPRPMPNRDLTEQAIAKAMSSDFELPIFKTWRRFPGAHEALASTHERLRSWNLDPIDLEEQATRVEPGLGGKLVELAQIYQRTEEILGKLGRAYNRWRMTEMLAMEAPPELKATTLVVLAADEVKPLEKQWLDWYRKTGADVIVLVDAAPGDEYYAGGEFWGDFAAPERLPELANAVYGEKKGTDIEVRVWRAPDVMGECEWVVRDIAERLADGEPAADIAIFARAVDDYVPRLVMAARRHGVPLRTSFPRPLLSRPFAQFVFSLLESLAAPTPRGLISLAKRSYTGSSQLQAEETTRALRGCLRLEDPWESLGAWVREQETPPLWLDEALTWRKELGLDSHPLAKWHSRLSELFAQSWMLEALAKNDDDDDLVAHALIRGLSTAASVDSEFAVSLTRAPEVLRAIWDRDQVLATGNPNGIRVVGTAVSLGFAHRVYALGMVEGRFPRSRREEPVLTDDDWNHLSALLPEGTPPFPTSRETAKKERDEFVRLLSAPSRSLTLCYPASEGDRQNMPAFYLEEVRQALGLEERRIPRRPWVPASPFTEADQRLAAALVEDPPPLVEFELADETIRIEVADNESDRFSVARYVDACECPFRHLARRRLGIRPHGERHLYGGLPRLPRDARLSQAPDPETARRNLEASLDEQLAEQAGYGAPDQLRLLEAAGKRMIDDWISREFDARQLWPRDDYMPDPTGFEFPPFEGKFVERISGDLAAVSIRGGSPVIHAFHSRRPRNTDPNAQGLDEIAEDLRFWVGLHLMALNERGGLEVDSPGYRTFIGPRERFKSGSSSNRKHSAILLNGEDMADLRRFTFDQTKTAVRVIREGIVQVKPSDSNCRFCDYGELCRRSAHFSEAPDPFEREEFGS